MPTFRSSVLGCNEGTPRATEVEALSSGNPGFRRPDTGLKARTTPTKRASQFCTHVTLLGHAGLRKALAVPHFCVVIGY